MCMRMCLCPCACAGGHLRVRGSVIQYSFKGICHLTAVAAVAGCNRVHLIRAAAGCHTLAPPDLPGNQ